MVEYTRPLPRRFRVDLFRLIVVCVHLALLLGTTAYLLSFVLHAWFLLPYPYPLDYGEGPLLAQIKLLHSGIPIWQIYSDPASPPSIIVNYPPFYPWLVATLSHLPELVGIPAATPLHVGRLVSLLATAGCALAIFLLTRDQHHRTAQQSADRTDRWLFAARHWLLALLFLTIPIVREWGVLLRVDILGICLGLWGLVALRTALHGDAADAPGWWSRYGWAGLAGMLLLLTLFTKPSLIAAPGAACLWLVIAVLTTWQPGAQRAVVWRTALIVFAMLGAGGGLLAALLQWASDGWFLLHVVTANANRWDADLARGFWEQQAALRWTLALAGGVAAVWLAVSRRSERMWLLPLLYTIAAVPMAVGVGKVGAYANYFLELYAGLVWLITAALTDPRLLQRPRHLSDSALLDRLLAAPPGTSDEPHQQHWSKRFSPLRALHAWHQPAAIGMILLVVASFAFYSPLWSKTWLRQAGIVDENPPRLAFGRYGLWRDLQREVEIVQAQHRVHAALMREVSAVPGETIFTDMPGVAVEAGKRARFQVFEHRQLLDQGYWEQQPLLLELANGELPLVVLDYLGNWLTPEMIEIITRRYAMDGSLGTFDIYRPVAPGPRRPANLTFDGLHLSGYHLNEPGSTTTPISSGQLAPLQAGNLLVVTLEFQTFAISPANAPAIWGVGDVPDVVLQLTDETGYMMLESERPLLYGALHPDAWSSPVQHMQPITLPLDLPPATYHLNVLLRNSGRDLSPPQFLTSVRVGTERGNYVAETHYFVSTPILQEWYRLGGTQRIGNPLTPAVPFAWGVLQCFEYTCLELRDSSVVQRPLGEQLYLAETLRSATCVDGTPFTSGTSSICPTFAADWQQYGGEESMGMGISGAISRYGYMVQWTRYARLEQSLEGGPTGLGRLGDDTQRLPPGMRYRWP